VLKHDEIEDSAWAVRNIVEKYPNFIRFIFFDSKYLIKIVTILSKLHLEYSDPVCSFLSESY